MIYAILIGLALIVLVEFLIEIREDDDDVPRDRF